MTILAFLLLIVVSMIVLGIVFVGIDLLASDHDGMKPQPGNAYSLGMAIALIGWITYGTAVLVGWALRTVGWSA